jgi:hypothetical protein
VTLNVGDDDVRAGGCELFGERAPDASRPSGHDGSAIEERIQVASLPQCENSTSILIRTASSILIKGGPNFGEVQLLASGPTLIG